MDLRCHGESASLRKRGPHSVMSAARDVLQLVSPFKCYRHLLTIFSVLGKQISLTPIPCYQNLSAYIRVNMLGIVPTGFGFEHINVVFITDGTAEAYSSCLDRA